MRAATVAFYTCLLLAAPLTLEAAEGAEEGVLLHADAVLGFNEPKISPVEAAQYWSQIERKAAVKGIRRIGSPAPVGDGYFTWLDEFLRNCARCKVDFVTAHIFKKRALGTHSLQSMLAAIHEQYGVPIWLTEFNAGGLQHNLTAAEHLDFMEDALPLLEHVPYVERYAWSAVCSDQMPNAALLDCGTMELTDIGIFYRDYDHSQHPHRQRSLIASESELVDDDSADDDSADDDSADE